MLRFENITKVFKTDILTAPVVALESVNLHIKSHSMVGFLGANGAGKTTSMKIMLDFIRADHGSVIYGHELGGNLKNALSKIGFLPERKTEVLIAGKKIEYDAMAHGSKAKSDEFYKDYIFIGQSKIYYINGVKNIDDSVGYYYKRK